MVTLSDDVKDDPTDNGTRISDAVIPAVRTRDWFKSLPDRVLTHLTELGNSYAEASGLVQVTRLQHSLETATLAYRDGRDEEYVVCALIHDIGDLLAPYNHGEFAAALLQPYISERNYWMLAHHHVFQGYYYFEPMGLDPNMREKYRDHPHFEYTMEFCEKYDMPAFDPDMDHMALGEFEVVVRRVMYNPKYSIYVPADPL
jgi:predicted HD phosphohydrolase